MSASDEAFDRDFHERAEERKRSAWARVVPLAEADNDDPDDDAATPSDRLALVDTLMILTLRETIPDGTVPRLQRSVVRVFKRGR